MTQVRLSQDMCSLAMLNCNHGSKCQVQLSICVSL